MRLKRKIPTFVFGVTVGIILGGAFFIFKINDIFNKFKDNAKSEITVIEQQVSEEKEEGKKSTKNKERFKIKTGPASKLNYKEVDSLIASSSDVNVAREEMLTVKSLKAIHVTDSPTASDSLSRRDDPFFVEFWKTPLNTKGYKFTKNRILLYGFVDFNSVLLFELNGTFYIRSNDQVYKIDPSASFSPLEKVIDSELLARLN